MLKKTVILAGIIAVGLQAAATNPTQQVSVQVAMKYTVRLPFTPATKQVSVQVGMKYTVHLPFTPATTILSLKQALQDHEGIPVDQQAWYKRQETWRMFSFSKKTPIELANEHTCQHYDIQSTDELACMIQLRGKSLTQ